MKKTMLLICGVIFFAGCANRTYTTSVDECKPKWYKNKEVTPVSIKINRNDFDTISFSYWTNDENYTIIDVTGMKMYPNNINQCYKEKKDQVKIIKESFTSLKEKSEKGKHSADKSGKSKFDSTEFNFKSGGFIRIACYDWSKEMNYDDHFRMGLLSAEFIDWLENKAFN